MKRMTTRCDPHRRPSPREYATAPRTCPRSSRPRRAGACTAQSLRCLCNTPLRCAPSSPPVPPPPRRRSRSSLLLFFHDRPTRGSAASRFDYPQGLAVVPPPRPRRGVQSTAPSFRHRIQCTFRNGTGTVVLWCARGRDYLRYSGKWCRASHDSPSTMS